MVPHGSALAGWHDTLRLVPRPFAGSATAMRAVRACVVTPRGSQLVVNELNASSSDASSRASGAAPAVRTDKPGRLLARLGIERDVIRYAVLLWVLSRAGFIAITLLATRFLRHIGGPTDFIGTWARFDATYYARLASDNYQASLPYRAAFFPLDPLAIRIVAPLVGGNVYLAGIVVSNVCFFIALLGLGTLARVDFDLPTARRAMLYLTIYPAALFLFAGYSEGLFIALAAWCFVAIRRHWWWQAGVLGLLAAMTRQVGLFLVLPFAWEYAQGARWRLRALRPNVLAVALIPTGLLLFMAWLWRTMGDPLAFLHAQRYWQRTYAMPWTAVEQAIKLLVHSSDFISRFSNLVDFSMVALMSVLLVWGARRMPLSYTLYSAAVILLTLSVPSLGWPLLSGARVMLTAFPCLLVLATEGRRPWLHIAIVVGFAGALLILTQYFVRGAVII